MGYKQTAGRLARFSRFLGILSIIIPLISLIVRFVPQEGTLLSSIILMLMIYGGIICGVPGYLMAVIARRDYDAIRDDMMMAVISTSGTLNTVGIVISLLFLCVFLNPGIAF